MGNRGHGVGESGQKCCYLEQKKQIAGEIQWCWLIFWVEPVSAHCLLGNDR